MDRKTWFPETDVDKSIEPPNQHKAIIYPWTSISAKQIGRLIDRWIHRYIHTYTYIYI